ncbi:hypothetical protein ABEB36_014694 [Hypothenemus hampei]|uniref:J domain-containing protein n=1 Tax=Hypothenemus hampei TaxID=57062 RepID=A0ABD1E2K4_HYPHA
MAVILTKYRLLKNPLGQVWTAAYSKYLDDKKYKKCFKILEIEETWDQEQIRIAYLKLVKRYHPDSGTEEANADKFYAIDDAFKTLMQKKPKEQLNIDEPEIVQEQDINHAAPQHRQYLSYGGVGIGNPYQREKQYMKNRAAKASENVYNHRIAKMNANEQSLMEKVPLNHKIKTMYGFDRLVEDLIQESMSKGEFSNLKNSGKPLPDQNTNHYVDFITHKINKVLIDNGFAPEWILLQKEILEEAATLRKKLFAERQYFGPYPLSIEDNIEWSDRVYKYQNIVDKINKKIAKFNLVVPILNKQMMPICLEKEAQRTMVIGQGYEDIRFDNSKKDNKKLLEKSENNDNSVNLFSFIDFIFKPK